MPPTPYVISGTVTIGPIEDLATYSGTVGSGGGEDNVDLVLDDGTLTGSSLTVTFTHTSSGETMTQTTNSSGQYVFDLGNMTNSWSAGDAFTISVTTITATSENQEIKHIGSKAYKMVQVDKRGDEYTQDYPIPVNNKARTKIEGYNGTRWRNIGIDKATRTLNIIDYDHHEVHEGSSFTAHFDNTTASTDDHRTAIGFKTPNTSKWGHITIEIIASSPAEFSIFEAPTINDGEGTEITIFNRNRNSSNTSTMLSLTSPGIAGQATRYIEAQLGTLSGGTLIEHSLLAGGEGPKAVGGSTRGAQEIILKQNTKYVFVIQNVGANANLHEIRLDWYELTNKD